jgi:hypothetical protein
MLDLFVSTAFFFQISKNPITAEGACLAIRLIKEHPDCGLQLLEMKVKLCNTLVC